MQMTGRVTFKCGWWMAVYVLLCGLLPGFAATSYRPVSTDPLLESWRWHSFPQLSGLSAQCMTEGSDGKLWFGMISGIWSYDGNEWAASTPGQLIHDRNVVSLAASKDGIVYAGTVRSVNGILAHRNGMWTEIFSAGNSGFGEIRKLATARDGSLWAATAWGALRFKGSEWTLFTVGEIAARLETNKTSVPLKVELLPEALLSRPRTNSLPTLRYDLVDVAVDSRDRVWLGTDGGEALQFDPAGDSTNSVSEGTPGRWTLHNELDGLVCGRGPYLLPLRDGKIWVMYTSDSDCLNEWDGSRWTATPIPNVDVTGHFTNPIQTRDGVVWTSGRYMIHVCRDGRWRTYQKPEVPIPTARNFLFQSSDGALWIGGSGTEIQRIDYQTPRWLTLQDLNFQWESPSGTQWFLHRSGRVVSRNAGQWISYGPEDGVIDAPVALVASRDGGIWVAGSHQQTAATARFDGRQWTRHVHDELSWGIDPRGVLASSDGSVWFSAMVDTSAANQCRAGILQYRKGEWIHHHQPGRTPRNGNDTNAFTLLPATQRPEPVGKFSCLGESPDGRIWAGRNILVYHDASKWTSFSMPAEYRLGIIDVLFTSQERELWIGTRQYGALRYDGREWRQYQGKDSLTANSVRSLAQTTDGSIWAATDRSTSRFDGASWTDDVLPPQLNLPQDGGALKASASGALWINRFAPEWNRRAWSKTTRFNPTNCEFWTVCHGFKGTPPDTFITSGTKTVSQPGNMAVFWSGTAPWRETRNAQLQFSHRLDGKSWSPFTSERGNAFFSLPSGSHRLEVRARDRDFNIDPTPASLDFKVLPPIWKQGWFILLMILLPGLIVTQSVRVLLEQRRLRQANLILAAEVREREMTQKRIREQAALLDQTQDAILVLGLDRRLRYLNRSAERFYAPQPGPVSDLNAAALLFPDNPERLGEICKVALERGQWSGEIVCTTARGARRIVLSRWSLVQETGGDPSAFLIVNSDVTEQKRLEEQFLRAQRMESIGTLASGVAHDLNNILSPILMAADLLRPMATNAEDQELITMLETEARRGAGIIKQLLTYGRGVEGERVVLQLRPLLKELAKVIRETFPKNLTLEQQLPEDLWTVMADPTQIHQVLLNLCVNARDAMPQGGQLTIAAENVVVDAAYTAMNPEAKPGPYVVLRVGDTGTGMSAEIQQKIFEPFFTTKEFGKGTGLGLSTVLGIVKSHGGFLQVHSRVGEGTQFKVCLPASVDVQELPSKIAATDLPSGHGELVMIVDDEDAVRAVARHTLETNGYSVITASDGAEALLVFFRSRIPIKAVITDMFMPVMEGAALIRALKRHSPELKVVAMGGLADQEEVAIQAGLSRGLFLHKPFSAEQLVRMLHKALEEQMNPQS